LAAAMMSPLKNGSRIFALALLDRFGSLFGRQPIYIPGHGRPGDMSIGATPDGPFGEKLMTPKDGTRWHDRVAARSLLSFSWRRPVRRAASVRVPFLLVVPEADAIAPVPAALSGPWANVHNAFDPGDLANLPLAPRDPLFFAHLCNFDRLWTSWIAMGHVNPDFGDARVYFYDENKEWCYVLQNDLRNEARLGYRYPSLMQPTVPASTFSSWQARRTATGFVLGDPDIAAIKERISVPKILILQNIRRLESLTPGSVKFGVFAGPVIAGRPGTSQPTYLGMVSRVRNKDHNQVGPVSAALNVTSRLSLILDKKLVGLRVAALDHAGKTMGLGIPLAADSISLMG